MINVDDDELRLKNVFWADVRSRVAYESFGDVITFDTTYLTNAYKMPFVLFVGVNHHGQSILFGCRLISNDDVQTFEWLFDSWLKCLNDRPPNAIITDQNEAMKITISKVFPTSRHRFYLWHIMKKLPKKFGTYSRYGEIKYTLQKCIYDSISEDDFQHSWNDFLNAYGLHDNAWLGSLYGDRHFWVPTYVKYTFWAGMSTTQQSESMNTFFDDYVNSKTTLKQFVEQYDSAFRRKVDNEAIADFKSFNTVVPCITQYPIERQFQKHYIIAKFKEVQEQFWGFVYLSTELLACEGGSFTYLVADEVPVSDGTIKRANYNVKLDENPLDVRCDCKLFEFKGILCRHALRILAKLGKSTVPSKYILDRYRKDIKRKYIFVKDTYKLSNNYNWKSDIVDPVHPSTFMEGMRSKILSPLVVQSKGRPLTIKKVHLVEKTLKKPSTRRRLHYVDDVEKSSHLLDERDVSSAQHDPPQTQVQQTPVWAHVSGFFPLPPTITPPMQDQG